MFQSKTEEFEFPNLPSSQTNMHGSLPSGENSETSGVTLTHQENKKMLRSKQEGKAKHTLPKTPPLAQHFRRI